MTQWLWLSAGIGVLIAGRLSGADIPRAATPLGIFEDHGDIGVPSTIGSGSASYDAATRVYTIAGGGENMWAAADHFHYVWKKMSGDVTVSATVAFTATQPATGAPGEHRKAVLLIRQTLDSDAAYVDAAAHGNGMTALQWRQRQGDVSHDIETNVVGPKRLRLEKRGSTVAMFVAEPGGPWRPAGGSTRVAITGEFYVGLGVSSHDTARIETATFSDVEVSPLAPLGAQAALASTIETISLGSKDRRVAHVSLETDPAEAPNWFPDATSTLYFNRGGRLYRLKADLPRSAPNLSGPLQPEAVNVGGLTRIGHDHVLSTDGALWAVSDQAQGSLVYTAPVAGGPATKVTTQSPSYVRSFSPDRRTLAFAGERNGNLDIYTIPAAGGVEQRLTTTPSKDDGPEFSPDGQFIYFNSNRTGSMQVWRMKADGSAQEQLTNDEFSNWCPHVAPNGQFIVFVSASKHVGDHLDNQDVTLRRMNLADRATDELATLYGGKGTLNVASFAPTSQHLAFVSYQKVAR